MDRKCIKLVEKYEEKKFKLWEDLFELRYSDAEGAEEMIKEFESNGTRNELNHSFLRRSIADTRSRRIKGLGKNSSIPLTEAISLKVSLSLAEEATISWDFLRTKQKVL